MPMSFPEPIILGESKPIQKVRELIRLLAEIDLNVLICGESGVGKELVARSLHYYSKRRNRPFVKVNCAALPTQLIESELFGYERGAFTGADRQTIGKFEQSGEGTIFLDEIGEIALSVQAKLLQVLQDRNFPRVGGHKDIEVKARVVTATNRNLKADLIAGNFREDLYYRINIIQIPVPPLREHKEDIGLLIDHLVKEQQKEYELPDFRIDSHLVDLFYQYHWPGNIRQLENYIKRLTILGNTEEFEEEFRAQINKQREGEGSLQVEAKASTDIAPAATDVPDADDFTSLKEIRDKAVYAVESKVIKRVLDENNWNRKKTAKILKISYRALLYKIKDMKIKTY